MTTVTMPYTLTGDTYVRSDKIEGNFNYIKQFFNGADGVGISSTNLSSTLTPEQIAEGNSLSYVTLSVTKAYSPDGSEFVEIPVFDEMTMRSLALNVYSNDGAPCSATALLEITIGDGSPTETTWLSFDSSKKNNAAIVSFSAGKVVPAEGALSLFVTDMSSNVDIATAILCFSHKHTSK